MACVMPKMPENLSSVMSLSDILTSSCPLLVLLNFLCGVLQVDALSAVH